MNISDQCRSNFLLSTFSSPSLLTSSSTGPLHFLPYGHPQTLTLTSSPSLRSPPSPLSPLHNLFYSTLSFLPHSSISSLASNLLTNQENDSLSFNLLSALQLGPKFVLFFPTGDNFHLIGYASLSFDSYFKLGTVFVQKDGLKHPCHRILNMSAVPEEEDNVAGFLIASTLYSVSWFRVESRGDGVGLVSVAKQGFEIVVVDAKMSAECGEMSVVLLENGELCWFDLENMRSGKVRVCEGFDRGWLGCEFGWQPWSVVVGCDTRVVVLDLRDLKKEAKVLVEKEQILAFCKCKFNDFYISVVTERQVLLYDIREPLDPILTWDHGLCSPSYVSMFRLSELRPSEKYKWASDYGSGILVGSFFKDDFNLFFYGPREESVIYNSVPYAWELPLKFSLSSRNCDLGDKLAKNITLINLESDIKKDVVVGFWIVPNNFSTVESEFGGFSLVRLMFSGRLEMQRYHASWDYVNKKSNDEGDELPIVKDANWKKHGASMRYNTLNFRYLWKYMNGFSSNRLVLNTNKLNQCCQKFPIDHIEEFKRMNCESSNIPIYTTICEATVPTSIFEITVRGVLNNLELDLLPLAFSKYSFLVERDHETISTLLQVPKRLPHHRSIPFFVGKPSSTSEKCSKKFTQDEALVGPALPIPILLLHQWMDNHTTSSNMEEELNDDLVTARCKTTLENLYPEISLADNDGSSQKLQNEKSFFVYEKSVSGKGCAEHSALKEELPQIENACEDEKFTTFICGIADKAFYINSHSDEGLEMFDRLIHYKLDFESPAIVFQPKEKEMFKRLTRQSCKWLESFKPHEDFRASLDIPK